MNRKRLFLIAALALTLAGFTSLLVYKLMNAHLNAKGPMVTVVVAAADLEPGARLEEKDLRLVKLPDTDLPDGYFQNATEIVGRGVIVPIFKNDLVLNKKLAAEKAGSGLPSMIPSGMRAVSVKVNDVVNVAGFAVPGTRVDVLVTGNPDKSNDPGNVTTTTVLENVQVLTAGTKLQQASDGSAQNFPVITLLVSPEDAQKLTLASMEGRIQLALRNPLDVEKPAPGGLKNAMLYGTVQAPSPHKKQVKVVVPAATPAYTVELIRGDKRDVARF